MFSGPFEDRLMIRELMDAYADAVMRRDAADWGSLWAEDSCWNMPDYPQIGTVQGRAAIVAAWSAIMAHFPGVIFVAALGHVVVEGAVATARSYTSEVYDLDGVTKRDRGVYDDRLVRQSGQWLFASRTFRNLHRA